MLKMVHNATNVLSVEQTSFYVNKNYGYTPTKHNTSES